MCALDVCPPYEAARSRASRAQLGAAIGSATSLDQHFSPLDIAYVFASCERLCVAIGFDLDVRPPYEAARSRASRT